MAGPSLASQSPPINLTPQQREALQANVIKSLHADTLGPSFQKEFNSFISNIPDTGLTEFNSNLARVDLDPNGPHYAENVFRAANSSGSLEVPDRVIIASALGLEPTPGEFQSTPTTRNLRSQIYQASEWVAQGPTAIAAGPTNAQGIPVLGILVGTPDSATPSLAAASQVKLSEAQPNVAPDKPAANPTDTGTSPSLPPSSVTQAPTSSVPLAQSAQVVHQQGHQHQGGQHHARPHRSLNVALAHDDPTDHMADQLNAQVLKNGHETGHYTSDLMLAKIQGETPGSPPVSPDKKAVPGKTAPATTLASKPPKKQMSPVSSL